MKPSASRTLLKVFDLIERATPTLSDNLALARKAYHLPFYVDALDANAYLCTLHLDGWRLTRSMLLLR